MTEIRHTHKPVSLICNKWTEQMQLYATIYLRHDISAQCIPCLRLAKCTYCYTWKSHSTFH